MIGRSFAKPLGGLLLLAMSACSVGDVRLGEDAWNVERVAAMPAPQDAFLAGLFDGYLTLARIELAERDWVDAAHFLAKAKAAGSEELPAPEGMKDHTIAEPMAVEMAAAEAQMQALFAARSAQLRARAEMAEVQVAWDCWVQEAEEGHQPDDIDICKRAFDESLAKARDAAALPGDFIVVLPEDDGSIGGVVVSADGAGDLVLDKPFAAGSGRGAALPVDEAEIRDHFSSALASHPRAARQFTILFDTGSAQINPDGLAVVAEITDEVIAHGVAELIVTGHTDAMGSPTFNLRLSKRRADAVRRAVLDRVGANALVTHETTWRGETEMIVPTPKDEEENRRVEIIVR